LAEADPTLLFRTASEFERWLEENHASSNGVWIQMAKKASGIESIDHPQAIETALCFGWIDGRREARPKVRAAFEQLDSRNRYAILYRLHDAKRPETRARRLADFVAKLEAGERPYPR
jgi:uncharacterized protein YdeI (YjbR/CyaY-like superfamily)